MKPPDHVGDSALLTNNTLVSYTFDSRNRLPSVGGLTYGYDPAGSRVAITNGAEVTRFVVNPNAALSQVLMRVENGLTNYYVYGVGLLYEADDAGNTKTYHFDYRGSTVAITDGTGAVTDRVEYSSYGGVTYRSGSTDTPFLFNGRYGVQSDANGLLYMRARYHNPYICRFVNPDPAGFSGGLNFYAYADGNPVSLVDPFGLWSLDQTFGVMRAVGGVFETAAGIGLAAATGWSGVGAVGGGLVAVHGLDQIQAGPGGHADSLTSQGLQAAGMSRNAANLTDAGISIVGSLGAVVGTASIRATQIAAESPALAQGMSSWQILTTQNAGSRALNAADYWGLGGQFTSALEKGAKMQSGAYPLTTTFSQEMWQGTRLFLGFEGAGGMGLTPLGYLGSGALGSVSGVGNAIQGYNAGK